MANPLAHYDQFNQPHTEPTVSGVVELDANEPRQPDLVNTLVILSPFRSGKPLELVRHRSFSSIQNLHDPNRNGDQGVELARVAKDSFSDRDVFGAGPIITCRVDPSTNAALVIHDGANNDLIRIERTDYGSHTNGAGMTLGAGTALGKKLTLTDTVRTLIGDNLGILMTIRYTGNGSAATVTLKYGIGKIAYSGQPADADKLTINGVIFEFDNDDTVSGANTPVAIGATVDDTFAALAAALTATLHNVSVAHDATNNVVTVTAFEEGVTLVETLDTGNVVTLTHLPPAARLQTELTAATDGSQPLDIALGLSQFKSIDRLASYINSQLGYTCTVSPYADKFLPSTGLDVVAGVNIKAAPVLMTGYVAALVNWVNTRTRGQYRATEIARTEPVDQSAAFEGGSTRPVTAADWETAYNLVGAGLERGGLLLVDTDDPAIFTMGAQFVEEQRTNGKWFRLFFGAQPGLIPDGRNIAAYDAIAAGIDSERCRLYVQRFGQFKPETNSIDYLHPVFYAAAMAGGAAGNLPFAKPLTNKRLRFAGLHADDAFVVETREALLEAGVTVAKQEQDRLVTVLAVTTSRDPDRRMARIMSEIDTVDLIDSAVREAFLPFRGQWADRYIAGRVKGTLTKVLQRFVDQGALVPGKSAEGAFIPAWRFPSDPPFVIEAGVVRLQYQIYIGSEINHIDLHGRATYQRLVGEISGSVLDRSVSVPL